MGGATDTCTEACADGWWTNVNLCVKCTPVSGALSSATYTCTSAADSRVSACAASSTTKRTEGAAGATDTCTEACADGWWTNVNLCVKCTPVSGALSSATYTCTS